MSYSRNHCACGETSSHTAAINRSVSAYLWDNVPTHEIDHNIHWLRLQCSNIEHQISKLKKLKDSRQRTKNWHDGMNDIARQFYDEDALNLDLEIRTQIIKQRLGCSYDRARYIAEIVHSWAKKKRRKNRDEQILLARNSGVSVMKLSKKYGIVKLR